MILSPVKAEAHLGDLIALLLDAIAGGASVGFLATIDRGEAETYWRSVVDAMRAGDRTLLVEFLNGAAVGTVQLAREPRANGRHRGEAMKMFVHSRARRGGVATKLMKELEKEALRIGITLLVMDTRTDSQGEKLCQALGYTRWGEVPGYALDPDGTPRATSFYYRRLNG